MIAASVVLVGFAQGPATGASEPSQPIAAKVIPAHEEDEGLNPPQGSAAARQIVAGLDAERFRKDVTALAAFGDRRTGSTNFAAAADWVEGQLKEIGYTVERQVFKRRNGDRAANLMSTLIGTAQPDRMFIVTAHLDGKGGGGAADDDASGVALVLAAARALAAPGVQTAVSVRFILWDAEETGLEGSRAYVAARQQLQGREAPASSGRYPEPRWLGIIQHDMLLYDHGVPAGAAQAAGADLDVEYRAGTAAATASRRLAEALQAGNRLYAGKPAYPVEVNNHSTNTDDTPFHNVAAAVSVRENRRKNEIAGIHPYYHTAQDLPERYAEADWQLGFAAVRTTVGTVAELAGARVDTPPVK